MPGPTRELARGVGAGFKFGTVSALDALIHLPKELFERTWDERKYPLDFLPITASQQNASQTVQIVANRDYVMVGLYYDARDSVTDLNPLTTPAPFTIQVQFSGGATIAGQVGANQGFVQIDSMCASFGNQKKRFEVAQFVQRQQTITAIVNNLNATARNLRIITLGFDVY